MAAPLPALACTAEIGVARGLDPPVLVDKNPADGLVEVELVAAPAEVELMAGRPARVWAFRDGATDTAGTIPGPLLALERGDRVRVDFRNELPEETMIHWHGLRLDNHSDGSHAAQHPVPPGGHFEYEFTATDTGLFWYHPHHRADVQVERGLYGAIVVRDDLDLDVAADRVLVLDDVKLEATGQLSTTTDALDIMLGRAGNVVLVNGRVAPSLDVAAGSRERWRFVNAANGRYFHLELPGRRLRVIGWDGGLLPEPYEVATLLVAPGERYDVLVELAGANGEELTLRTIHYDRGHGIPDPGPIDLLHLRLGPGARRPRPLPAQGGDGVALPVDAVSAERAMVLEEGGHGADATFSINGERYPDVTPVVVAPGTLEVWRIENHTEMDHPFHVHGMRFQVLDPLARDIPRLGWKDTVNVPRHSTVPILMRFFRPGRWMYHCHILEHAERGMAGELHVLEDVDAPVP